MSLTGIKVSQLDPNGSKLKNQDLVNVVKQVDTGEYVSVKAPLSEVSELVFENVKEEFYDFTIESSREDLDFVEATYVKKEVGKGLSSLSFEQADKDKLANLRTTNDLTEGTSNLYFKEDRVLETVMTGLLVGTDTAVSATDSLLLAIAKLQAQIDALKAAP